MTFTFVNIILLPKRQKYIKTIPPPNAAIPLVWTLYLEPPLLCQIWDYLPDCLIEMRQLAFLFEIQSSKVFENWLPAFGTILVLGGSQFPLKILLKKYSKIDFSSFWHDLGFWWQLVSIKNFNFKNIRFLVLVCNIFRQKTAKKYKKDTSSKRSHTPWWTLYLEPPFCIRFGVVHSDSDEDRMHDCWPVVNLILPKKNKNI